MSLQIGLCTRIEASEPCKGVGKIVKLKLDISDVLVFAGMALAGAGIWMIFKPACFIFLGLMFIYIGWPRKGGGD